MIQEQKEEIIKKICVLLILIIISATSYTAGRYNLPNENFFNYNLNLGATEIQEAIKNIPEKTNQTKFNMAFIELENGTPTYHEEEITISEVNLNRLGGLYIGGNEIFVKDIKDNSVIGHELCHLILNKYGVHDVVINENVCYTVQNNYEFNGGLND